MRFVIGMKKNEGIERFSACLPLFPISQDLTSHRIFIHDQKLGKGKCS
jgi:hypothetical protein